MRKAAPIEFKTMFILVSASAVATQAASQIVGRIVHPPSMAIDVAATFGGILIAVALVYALARIMLGAGADASRLLGPLSRPAWVELAVGVPALFAIAVVLKVRLDVDMTLSFSLLYAPLAFLWLRREFARQ